MAPFDLSRWSRCAIIGATPLTRKLVGPRPGPRPTQQRDHHAARLCTVGHLLCGFWFCHHAELVAFRQDRWVLIFAIGRSPALEIKRTAGPSAPDMQMLHRRITCGFCNALVSADFLLPFLASLLSRKADHFGNSLLLFPRFSRWRQPVTLLALYPLSSRSEKLALAPTSHNALVQLFNQQTASKKDTSAKACRSAYPRRPQCTAILKLESIPLFYPSNENITLTSSLWDLPFGLETGCCSGRKASRTTATSQNAKHTRTITMPCVHGSDEFHSFHCFSLGLTR